MSGNWKAVRLSEVCTNISDGTHHSPDVQYSEPGKGRFKYVTSKNIRPWGLDLGDITYVDENTHREIYARCKPELGDVLLTKDGANTGTVAINTLEEEFSLLSSVALLKPNRDVLEPRFLRYFIESPVGSKKLVGEMTGTAIRRIILKKIRETEILLAPLSEQRRIVAEIEKQFTRLDAGVAALRRVQANLKRYRAAVLKAACEGKLVPTEAELHRQGKAAKFESGEELLERILADRRKNWSGRGKYKEPAAPDVKSLPSAPGGWAWVTWEQVGFSQNGRPFPSAEYQSSGVKLLRPGNLQANGKVVWSESNTRCMPQHWADKNSDLIVRGGEIVMNLTAQSLKDEFLGRVCLTDENEMCLLNQRLARLTPCVISAKFVLYLLKSWCFRRFVDGLNSGSLIQHMFTSQVAGFAFPLPPLAEQTRIVAEVERRLSVIDELEAVVTANLQRAARLRQSILQKAFSGELLAGNNEVPEDKIVKFPKASAKPLNKHFARAVLSAEIVHRLHDHPTFGRIKHQKIFHLCEYIAQIPEIEGQYHREAAGPFDNKLIYANEAELKKQKWFRSVERESFGHAYEAMEKAGAHRKYAEGAWPEKLATIDKLLDLMREWSTDRCEIFCTTYAAWNDLIILGKKPTEDAILNEVLNRWHPSKKRFPEDRWRKAIGWMRENGYEPTGFGKATKLR